MRDSTIIDSSQLKQVYLNHSRLPTSSATAKKTPYCWVPEAVIKVDLKARVNNDPLCLGYSPVVTGSAWPVAVQSPLSLTPLPLTRRDNHMGGLDILCNALCRLTCMASCLQDHSTLRKPNCTESNRTKIVRPRPVCLII